MADAEVREKNPEQNFGSNSELKLREKTGGARRGVFRMDSPAILEAVGAGTLVSATLELELKVPVAGGVPETGVSVNVHRLTQAWTESGVTWSCSDDQNSSPNGESCSGADDWDLGLSGAWEAGASAGSTVYQGQTGVLSLDVTGDVQGFLGGTYDNNGWLVRLGQTPGADSADDDDGDAGDDDDGKARAKLYAAGTPNGPRLVLEIAEPSGTTGSGTTTGASAEGGGENGTGATSSTAGTGGSTGTGGDPPTPLGTVQGRLVEAGTDAPIAGALVTVAGATAVTDNNGTFVLESVGVGADQNITATADGFSTAHNRVDVLDAEVTIIELCSAATVVDEVLAIEDGGMIETQDQVVVQVPPAAFVDADDNPVVGDVQLETTLLNTSEALMAAPGGMVGDVGGTEGPIESFGMVEFKFTQDGQELNLAPGTDAEIRIPLSDGHGFAEGEFVGLWTFDEAAGIWVEEGVGQVLGMEFVATVSHFSWWNADQGIDSTGCITGTVVDDASNPLSGAALTLNGVDYNGQDQASADVDGSFCLAGLNGGTAELRVFFFDPDLGATVEWVSGPQLLPGGAECGGPGCLDMGNIVVDFQVSTCITGEVPGFVDLNPTPDVADELINWTLNNGGAPVESGVILGENLFGDPSFCVSAEFGAVDEVVVDGGCGPVAFMLDGSVGACGSAGCQVLDLASVFACQEPGGTTGGITTGGGPGDDGGGDGGGFICDPPDADGDGISVCAGDCDDLNGAAYPGAVEQCGDGVDTNCNGFGDVIPPEAGCITGAATGSTCSDFIDLGLGGGFSGDLTGATDDVQAEGCWPGGDQVLRFFVPEGPEQSVRILNSFSDEVGFSLYSGQQCDSPEQFWGCFDGDFETFLPPGQYFLEVSDFGMGTGGAYTVSVAQLDPGTGVCSIPDGDADGVTVCDGDCNDGDIAIFPGADDQCNGTDDNCDGTIDNPLGTCSTALQGACSVGTRACSTTGETCLQLVAATSEICADGADNDCDGVTDENGVDPDSCVTLGPGASCGLAIDIDGSNLAASGDFEAAIDTVSGDCFGAQGAVDQVVRFTVPDLGGSDPEVRIFPSSGNGPGADMGEVVYTVFANGCGAGADIVGCFHAMEPEFSLGQLSPGTYNVVASAYDYGGPTQSWGLQVAITDFDTGTCFIADGDGDMVSACDGDCSDNDASVFPGAVELCDGADNDCNGQTDDPFASCSTGLLGVCADGYSFCDGAVPGCGVSVSPGQQPEICGDGLDNDCNGQTDEAGCTTLPQGGSCTDPIDLGLGGAASGDFSSGTQITDGFCFPPESQVALSFTVPDLGGPLAEVHLTTNGASQEVGLTLFRDTCDGGGFQDCIFMPPGDEWIMPLEPGQYFLVTGSQMGGMQPEEQWAVQVTQFDDMGQCVVGDTDLDGFDVCQGDCAEGNNAVGPGAAETCDSVDNNCSGAIDDIPPNSCTVGGQQGPCAAGVDACSGGSPACQQVTFPSTEACGDDIDNDCDGEGQGTEDPDCVAGGGDGDDCGTALDLGTGGSVSSTLLGATDTWPESCGAMGADRFIRFEVPTMADQTTFTLSGDPSVTAEVWSGECGMFDQFYGCAGAGQTGLPLQPGIYHAIVSADVAAPFTVTVASESMGACSVPDNDGDGVTICAGDCNDDDVSVFPDAPEDCLDGLDNNCSGVADDAGGGTCSTGLSGECDNGQLQCTGMAAPDCVATVTPGELTEVCDDGNDSDCDGADSNAGCVTAQPGEFCANAIDVTVDGLMTGDLSTATDDLQNGCFGESTDLVFSVDIPADGNQYEVRIDANTAPMMGCINARLETASEGCDSGMAMCEFFFESWRPVDPGTNYIVAEGDPGCGGGAFSLQLQLRNVTAGECLLPTLSDADGDLSTVCDDDCDDDDALVFPGNVEVCDALDNNCDGQADNMQAACNTGLPGVCDPGHIECAGTGIELCEQDQLAVEEVCADGLDNNCDSVTDEAACVTIPPGSCENPIVIAEGAPVSGDLSMSLNDFGCLCGCGTGTDVLRLEIPAGVPEYQVDFDSTGSDDGTTIGISDEACESMGLLECSMPLSMGEQYTTFLQPGTYFVYVSNDFGMNLYDVSVTLSPM